MNRDAPLAGMTGLAFAGSRPVWADAWAERIAGQLSVRTCTSAVYATTATGRLRAIARLRHEDDGGGGPGGYLLSIAGDSSGGAYSWVRGTVEDASYSWSSGGVWTLADGISRRVPNLPPAWAMARSGSRLALVPIAVNSSIPQPEPAAVPDVVIATVAGKILVRFRAKHDVQALGAHVALPVRRRRRRQRWRSGSGDPRCDDREAAPVAPGPRRSLHVSVRSVCRFLGLDSVSLLDGTTGSIRRIAKTNYGRSRIIQATIYRGAVWWAVATKTPGSHNDTDNPADFVTSIHRDVLAG